MEPPRFSVNPLPRSYGLRWLFRSSSLPPTPDFSHSARAGDVNGDGTFTRSQSELPPQVASAEETYLSCALVDVDGDGRGDFITRPRRGRLNTGSSSS
jgi:hypothetical protein